MKLRTRDQELTHLTCQIQQHPPGQCYNPISAWMYCCCRHWYQCRQFAFCSWLTSAPSLVPINRLNSVIQWCSPQCSQHSNESKKFCVQSWHHTHPAILLRGTHSLMNWLLLPELEALLLSVLSASKFYRPQSISKEPEAFTQQELAASSCEQEKMILKIYLTWKQRTSFLLTKWEVIRIDPSTDNEVGQLVSRGSLHRC